MIIKDVNGVEIDTDSKAYKEYLRDREMDRLFPDVQEPTGWMTFGEVIERDRRRQEQGLLVERDSPVEARKPVTAVASKG